MKLLASLFVLIIMSSSVCAQDALSVLTLSEEKTYTPRAKSLRDIVVDIVSPQLTERLNDQKIFGKINEAIFRVYWTAEPERIAIEVVGLPDGFNEIKDELKISMISHFEAVLPVSLSKKFKPYSIKKDSRNPRIVIAVDPTHQLYVPEFEMFFASTGVLEKLVAKKPVGQITTSYSYEKESWSEPRYALVGTKTESVEGPQTIESSTEISYLVTSGMGLPSVLKTVTKQSIKAMEVGASPIERTSAESIFYKDYKVNSGVATKWFLAQNPPKETK